MLFCGYAEPSRPGFSALALRSGLKAVADSLDAWQGPLSAISTEDATLLKGWRDTFVGLATRVSDRLAEVRNTILAGLICSSSAPALSRVGVVFPLGKGRWIRDLWSGRGFERPKSDLEIE